MTISIENAISYADAKYENGSEIYDIRIALIDAGITDEGWNAVHAYLRDTFRLGVPAVQRANGVSARY